MLVIHQNIIPCRAPVEEAGFCLLHGKAGCLPAGQAGLLRNTQRRFYRSN